MIKFYLVVLLLSGLPRAAQAWGEDGHRITATIAQKHVSSSVLDSVNKYLQGMSWGDAACWMDAVRGDSRYRYMSRWHYVNLSADQDPANAKKPNVITQLEASVKILQDRRSQPREDIRKALLVIFHLVGDIHQPLHCGYAEDKGGNTAQLHYNGRGTNLHRLWDSDIIKSKGITAAKCDRLAKAEMKSAQAAEIAVWVTECRQLLPAVYNYTGHKVTTEYAESTAVIIRQQLQKAGLRLAEVLNSAFS